MTIEGLRALVLVLVLLLASPACLKQSPTIGDTVQPGDGCEGCGGDDGRPDPEPCDGCQPEPVEPCDGCDGEPDPEPCDACGEPPEEIPPVCGGATCGDGVCDPACGEDRTGPDLCVADCCRCGDGLCRYEPWCEENGAVCWSDCCEPKEQVCGNLSLEFDCDEHVAGPTFCYEDACRCGDGLCADGLEGRPTCAESEHTCPEDCCRCGDGKCVGTGSCGEFPEIGDTPSTCVIDCTVCGDGLCAGKEDYAACKVDCCGGCGDGECLGGECGETPTSCPQDCGADIACGNQKCDSGEDAVLCPQDCKHNACGNNQCENGEDVDGETPCAVDCTANCGDGLCDQEEDKYSCPLDCGYCGDGYFSLKIGETKENCPTDFCEDHDPCTDDSWKTEGGLVIGCVHAPNTAACDDGDPCTVGDTCVMGSCAPGSTTLTCDDGNPCTIDHCDKFQGGCTAEFDPEGLCTEDDNPCTRVACDAESRTCAPKPAEGSCDDGDPCTVVDACAGGVCVGSGQNTCDDQNPCTNDVCVTKQGCFYNDDGTDGTACVKTCETGTPTCASGECVCL